MAILPHTQIISAETGMHPQFLTNTKNKLDSYKKTLQVCLTATNSL